MVLGIEIEIVRAASVERAAEHPHDVRTFVVHDRFGLRIPQHRNGDVTRIIGLGVRVELVKIAGADRGIAGHAFAIAERPAAILHQPVNDIELDRIGEPFQMAHRIGAMRPGAGEADIKAIAPGFGGKAAFAGQAGRPVGRDPAAKRTLVALELAAVLVVMRPLVVPFAVLQISHDVRNSSVER